MQNATTPRGNRLQIGIFGRRNAGKSSLLNALVRQDVAIVSPVPGTTTDPVEKAAEFFPLGPVLFIDTAGVDDPDPLGIQRVERTMRILARCDLALMVIDGTVWDESEARLLTLLQQRGLPVVAALNKADLGQPCAGAAAALAAAKVPAIAVAATRGDGLDKLREALVAAAPADWFATPPLAADLVPPGGLALLVVPIDLEAPKGRLILPQVQTLRDLLDHDAMALVVKERELRAALERLATPPNLVITDSQAFLKVAADIPASVPLTSFSILFARAKGDLATFVEGVMAVDRLRAGDRILVAEACTHHPVGDDIGRVKIPRWLNQYAGVELTFETLQGHDFPADLSPYRMVIHCGSCTFNRQAMLGRIARCREANVPITNYGMVIARTLGVFPRALEPFPEALAVLARHRAT